MVSAAHRRKVYNDIPEEKKNLMLAAWRKIYRLNKQESMLGNTSLLATAQDGSVLGRERASLCAAVPPNVEAPVPSTVLQTVIPFVGHTTHIKSTLLSNFSVDDVPGPLNAVTMTMDVCGAKDMMSMISEGRYFGEGLISAGKIFAALWFASVMPTVRHRSAVRVVRT